MVITIHQPEHMPWLGFFYKMIVSDTFVVLDSVQYRKNYFQNRNQIVGTNGKPNWITVNVDLKGHLSTTIRDIRVKDSQWKVNYLNKVRESYRKHKYFDLHYNNIEDILVQFPTDGKLVDLNMQIINYIRLFLDINTPIQYSSELEVDGSKSDIVLNICKELGATQYLSGIGGKDYMNLEDFKDEDIEIQYNIYTPIEYPQFRVDSFIPYMSVLDLIMNLDAEESRDVILKSFKLER